MGDAQRPFLFLSGSKSVAEGYPLQVEPLVGQGTGHREGMVVESAVLDPCHVVYQSVAIALLISEGTGDDGVGEGVAALLQYLVSADDGVHGVYAVT